MHRLRRGSTSGYWPAMARLRFAADAVCGAFEDSLWGTNNKLGRIRDINAGEQV
jgi:hypothetical protein